MSKVTLNATSFATGGGTGTIGGSISVGQVAYGSGVNTITGDSGFTRDPTTKETSIAVALTGLISASYSISNNFLGFGLTGAGQIFNSGSGGYNLLASVNTTAFGGQPDTTFTGYTSFGPGPVANGQYTYKPSTDTAISSISAKSATSKSAQINVKADATTNKIEFVFATGNYKFPTTSPSAGQVMGYSSANQLDWVTPGGGISIGDAIGGSPINNAVLFVDGSGNLKDTGNFTFNASLNRFNVGVAGATTLTVDPTIGVVATSASAMTALSAVTPFGRALQVNTAGGMGNFIEMGDIPLTANKTRFAVVDSLSSQIFASLDGLFSVYKATGAVGKAFTVDTNYAGTGFKYTAQGDVDGLNNSTKFVTDDLNATITATMSGKFIIEDTSGHNLYETNGTTFITNIGDVDNSAGGGYISVDPLNNGVSMQRSRFLELQGADVVAANSLVVGSGNAFIVNGNTQINTLSGTGWQQGSEVVLQFTGTPTIKNLFGSTGSDIEFSLAGSADLVVATKTTVTFRWMGGVWQELARTVQ